jgi:hypothetical protein
MSARKYNPTEAELHIHRISLYPIRAMGVILAILLILLVALGGRIAARSVVPAQPPAAEFRIGSDADGPEMRKIKQQLIDSGAITLKEAAPQIPRDLQ